ncbi:MAG: TetR family transcriptional regulator C-terminal domain-containing protein [Elainellaceae cyanobacterium]
MSKADETRANIILRAASLFNQQGYAGATMSDIMKVTGLKKGGIYNHFSSKDELAIAAFDFAFQQVAQRYLEVLKEHQGAIDRLNAMVYTFTTAIEDAPIAGGCPLMNTAIDSDDAHPALRERAQQAMGRWRSLIHRIVDRGRQRGEVRDEVQADAVATILISTLEGALMMTKLCGDRVHLQRAQVHLDKYIDSLRDDSLTDAESQ